MPIVSFLASQSRLLSYRPLVAGSLVGSRALEGQIAMAVRSPVDLVEVRLDTFRGVYRARPEAIEFSAALLRDLRKRVRKPLLLTLRSPAECGKTQKRGERLSDRERAKRITPLLPLVRLVDLEIRSAAFTADMTRAAHRQGIDVIHSFHDFSGPSRPAVLDRMRALSRRLKGDIFKAAVAPRTNDELESFLNWGRTGGARERVALIGMGEIGLFSRVLGYSFGSILTFGHLGASAAPGQLPAGELRRLIRSMYPGPR